MEIISDTVVYDLSFNIAARVRIKDEYGETPSVNTVENACVVGDMDILYYDDETDTVLLSYRNNNGVTTSEWEELNEENFEAIKVPSWCKVGMWVTRNDCFTVEQVTDIKEGEIAVGYAYDDEAEFYRMFKPVHFRPYDYKEAKALLGKTIESEPPYLQVRYEGALIHRVTQYECAEEIHLNSRSFSAWKEMNATIDGLPIGVPVVDEELLSNP